MNQSPSEPAHRPADTIWECYRNDRNFFARPLFAMSFFILFFPYEWWLSERLLADFVDHSPETLAISLLGFLSAFAFGLCRGYFGLRKPAFTFALMLLAGWVGLTSFIIFLAWDDMEFTKEAAPVIGFATLFISFPGIAILYVTYLLWRTNSEQ